MFRSCVTDEVFSIPVEKTYSFLALFGFLEKNHLVKGNLLHFLKIFRLKKAYVALEGLPLGLLAL